MNTDEKIFNHKVSNLADHYNFVKGFVSVWDCFKKNQTQNSILKYGTLKQKLLNNFKFKTYQNKKM